MPKKTSGDEEIMVVVIRGPIIGPTINGIPEIRAVWGTRLNGKNSITTSGQCWGRWINGVSEKL